MRMWNTMKCFMSEFNRVSIDKVCWKAKMNYWYYMSAKNIWDNFQNDFNIKYMANNKQKKLMENSLQLHVIFKYLSESKECTLKQKPLLTIIHNKLKITELLPCCLLSFTLINLICLELIDDLPFE